MQIQPLNLSSRHECNFSGRPQTLASLRIKRNNFRDWIVESGRSRRHRFSRPDPIGFVRLEALVACAQAALTRKHKASLKRTLITTFYIFFSCSRLRQPTVENKLNVVFVFDWYWGLEGCSYHGWILNLILFLHPHDTSWNAPNAAMIQLSSHIQIAGLLLIGSIAVSLRPKCTVTVEWVLTCAYMLRIFLDMSIQLSDSRAQEEFYTPPSTCLQWTRFGLVSRCHQHRGSERDPPCPAVVNIKPAKSEISKN